LLTPFLAIEPPLSEDYLRDVIQNFLLAGRDTTSQTIAWCLYYLADNPAVQQRLFEEVSSVLGMDDDPQWKTHTDGALPYLNAVIKETLRLSPPGMYWCASKQQ
jgi:cytochrome P450